MSVNRYQPHILVLPEDDANRQLANGFLLNQSVSNRKIQVLAEAGGWREVLARFESDHIVGMDRFPGRVMVLLIDFDGQEERLTEAKKSIPDRLMNRVLILGVRTEPEELRRASLGSYEAIGLALAKDCLDETETTWSHELLRHNRDEINRLRQHVRPILFDPI